MFLSKTTFSNFFIIHSKFLNRPNKVIGYNPQTTLATVTVFTRSKILFFTTILLVIYQYSEDLISQLHYLTSSLTSSFSMPNISSYQIFFLDRLRYDFVVVIIAVEHPPHSEHSFNATE